MKDTDIFDGKKLSDLLKDIHDNSLEKRKNINSTIETLTNLINSTNAMIIVPLIRELYDVGVKNDAQVVQVATIVQRLISADSYQNGEGEGLMLSDAEKDRLLENALLDMKTQVEETNKTLDTVKAKVDVL